MTSPAIGAQAALDQLMAEGDEQLDAFLAAYRGDIARHGEKEAFGALVGALPQSDRSLLQLLLVMATRRLAATPSPDGGDSRD